MFGRRDRDLQRGHERQQQPQHDALERGGARRAVAAHAHRRALMRPSCLRRPRAAASITRRADAGEAPEVAGHAVAADGTAGRAAAHAPPFRRTTADRATAAIAPASVGPTSATIGVAVVEATCIGPVSPPMYTAARPVRTPRPSPIELAQIGHRGAKGAELRPGLGGDPRRGARVRRPAETMTAPAADPAAPGGTMTVVNAAAGQRRKRLMVASFPEREAPRCPLGPPAASPGLLTVTDALRGPPATAPHACGSVAPSR